MSERTVHGTEYYKDKIYLYINKPFKEIKKEVVEVDQVYMYEVLNFINNKLDKEETKAFIEHVRDCKDCWEELEIYYVMLVGLKQLDEGEELAADFRKKLQNEVESRYVEIEREAKRKHIAKIITILVTAAILIWMFAYLISAMLL